MRNQVAVVSSVLHETLFGTNIQYVDNYIQIDSEKRTGTYLGTLTSPYAYKPELRARLTELEDLVRGGSTNHYFVLDGTFVRAAQSSIEGAMRYMKPEYVLVAVF